MFRSAVIYVATIVVVAGVLLTVVALMGSHQLLWSTAVPVALFLGALSAFFNAYRFWRSKGTWPIWQERDGFC